MLTIIGILEILTGMGIYVFWVLFFKTNWMIPKDPPEGYLLHEKAFVYPDSIMALALIISGVLLLIGNPLGESISLVCAGGLMFLGVIDFAYDCQTGTFKKGLAESAGNLFIEIWVTAFGLFLALKFT